MAKNTGNEYENFVGRVYQSLIDAEGISHIKNIAVELDKKIKDKNGIARQFDVYWEFSLGGQIHKTVIECKDYASTITIEKVDAFIGKTADIPGLRLIYATKTGYQRGAKIKAKQHNIDLFIVREGVNDDWQLPDGTVLINQIHITGTLHNLPRITEFNPTVDKHWLDNNTKFSESDINAIFSKILNNGIFIYNSNDNTKVSLHELSALLIDRIPDINFGEGEYGEKNDNLYFTSEKGDIKIKMHSYKVKYTYAEPLTFTSSVDLSRELLAIVVNDSSGDKQMIFRDGTVKKGWDESS